MLIIALVLWGVVAIVNIIVAQKIYKHDPSFALGFILAALCFMLGAAMKYIYLPLMIPLLAMGTTFALLIPLAVATLVFNKITWSEHAIRAALLALVWVVWLSL
jgi:hypothetical protein